MAKSNLKTGLALGGGGARGFVHIGILRELENTVFKPHIITGTSIGAIIGAMYAATLDTHWIESRIQKFINSDMATRKKLARPTRYNVFKLIFNISIS